MKKLIPYVIVFVLGFAACAGILYHWYGQPQSATEPMTTGDVAKGPPLPGAVVGSDAVRLAAARVSRVVVNIDTRGRPRGIGFPFGEFFGFPFDPQPPVAVGQASGVMIRSDGYILTNNHVVADTQTRVVTLPNGKQYDGRVVGFDSRTDLAVIKINARNLPTARFADSDSIRVGDWAIAVGNPLSLGPTVTAGVISATRRDVKINDKVLEGMIQTDAAINPGNSGGALADLAGNVIGINTAIASTTPGGGNIGIGFATPSNTAKKIVDELIKRGRIARPWIGIVHSDLTEQFRDAYAQIGPKPPPGGVVVQEVAPNSPAAAAGLRPYDIIKEINRKPIKGRDAVVDAIRNRKPGNKIMLLIWRNGSTRIVPLTLGEAPSDLG